MYIGLFGPFDLVTRRGNSIRLLLQAKGLHESGFEDFSIYGYKVTESENMRFGEVGRHLYGKKLPIGQKIENLPVDLVHTHHFYGAMVLKQKYILDMPSIISLQIDQMYKHVGPLWKKMFLRKIMNPLYVREKEIRCIKKAEAVIVASNEIRENLESIYGLKNKKYYLVNNTVDLEKHQRSDLRNYVIGLSASDFRDAMDSHCLRVLHQICRHKKDIRFLIAGRTDPAQLDDFRGLENVEFLGQLTYDEYVKFLKRLSVFLMPYLGFYDYGGTKFKLLEAGASGLAIICSSFGAIGFDFKDKLCLANSVPEILEWIEELRIFDKRVAAGEAMHETIRKHFDYRSEAKKLIEIYKEHVG